MKNFLAENKNELFRIVLFSLLGILLIEVVMNVLPGLSFADDLFDEATSVISDSQQKIVNLALALCPLAIIFVAVCALLTHNEKKMAWYMQLGITIVVVTAIILVVNSGYVVDTLKNWFDFNNSVGN